MNMVLPDVGLRAWADYHVGMTGIVGGTWHVQLFKNNITVDASTTLAALTAADFPGAAVVTLDTTHWVAENPVSHVSYFRFTNPPTFTCTGGAGQLVYGWFMYGEAFPTNPLLAAQNFDTPRNMIPGWQEVLDPFRIGIKTLF